MERINIPAKQISDPKAITALRIAAETGQSAFKAVREAKYGKQLEFVFDQMTPQKYQTIERLYGRGGKGGTKR
jgi:phosphoribosylformylglycinamidine (FGAM) synthase PurS component